MGNSVSKRVRILRRVLRDIYKDDFQEIGERIVFGTKFETIGEG